MKPWGFWLQSRAPDPSLDVSLIDEPLTSTPVRPGAARRLTVNAETKKTASKKPVPVKKVVKTAAAPKAVANKAVKKPVAAKPVAAKKTPAKPVAAPKAVAKKPAVKAPVKATKAPVKATKAPVKTVKAPVKAAKAPAKVVKAPVKAVKAPVKVVKASVKAVKAPAKVVAKAPTKVAKAPVKVVKKPAAKVAAKKPAKAVAAPAPIVHVVPIIPGYTPVVHKKNSRAAKMAALVPPPPAQVVASNAAKNSFMPMTAPSAPTIVPVIPKKDAKLANNWKTKTADQMTDSEIVAMPDDAYMNDIQMAFFRLKLVKLKNEVLANASETTEHMREDTVVVPDPADRATIEEEHALELRTRDRERKLLKKIEQSIHRIDSGDYGYCDETGEAIGVGRLLARPTASLSLEAQERREIKQRMFGD
jgi:DnaK suppressor protein